MSENSSSTEGDFSPRWKLLTVCFVLLFALHLATMSSASAQAPLDINWAFKYTPLVSGAPNSLVVRIHNTALVPVRVLSLGIRFPWMQDDTYFSVTPTNDSDIAVDQVVGFTVPFEIPANVTTGKYTMNALLTYQLFQTTQWAGAESVVYVLDVAVIGRASPYQVTFDPYDGRVYAAFAIITLVGWYLPKKLRPGAKGQE